MSQNEPREQHRIAVVVNGNAKNVTEEVISTLDQILSGGDLFVSRHIDEASGIARTIVSRGYETVLTGGGDGTFIQMVTEVVREADRAGAPRPRFGLLRLGTGNALAWVIGASFAKGRGLSADIQRLRGETGSREMRLIGVSSMLTPFCGFGLDALALADYNRTKQALAKGPLKKLAGGPLGYFVSATTQSIPSNLVRKVPTARVINRGSDAVRIGPKGRPEGAPIGAGGLIYEGPARILSCGTIPYYGFGFRMFPYADERPDRMQLRISTISSASFIANFAAIWRGDYADPSCMFDYLVDDIEIELDDEVPFQIGGDAAGSRQRERIVLEPRPVRLVDFYAPPGVVS